MPLSFPSRRLRCSPVYLSRAVTTGPNTRVEVSVLGRLDMFLTTREPPSCFAGAPTSVWHRSRPSPCFSQRLPRGRDKQVMLCPSLLLYLLYLLLKILQRIFYQKLI